MTAPKLQHRLTVDGYLAMPVPITTRKKTRYAVLCDIEDANGNRVSRNITLIVP